MSGTSRSCGAHQSAFQKQLKFNWIYRALLRKKTLETRVSHCEQPNRVLKYARRTICWTYACQQAAHQEVLERKAHRAGTGERTKKAAPTFCYEVIAVHGQRDVDPALLMGARRRNKLAASNTNVSYLVYGEFEEHERDAGFKDNQLDSLDHRLDSLATSESGGPARRPPTARPLALRESGVRLDLRARSHDRRRRPTLCHTTIIGGPMKPNTRGGKVRSK